MADLVGIPEESVIELVDEWERLCEAYPEAARLWGSVGPDVDGTRLGWQKWLGYHAGEMLWNPRLLGRARDVVDGELAQSVCDGLHPAGCGSLTAVACHEFGHVVEEVARRRLGRAGWDDLCRELVARSISGYTDDEPAESFAMAFSVMHHGVELNEGASGAVGVVRSVLEGLGV